MRSSKISGFDYGFSGIYVSKHIKSGLRHIFESVGVRREKILRTFEAKPKKLRTSRTDTAAPGTV